MRLLLKFLFLESSKQNINEAIKDYSFLFVRVTTGLTMLFAHGIGKMTNFSKIAENFPDPFGFLGSNLSLGLVVVSEVFGSLLLAMGLLTRWASFSLLFTMLVAAFVIHLKDPFSTKELAFTYALLFFYFTFAGGGKYSLDALIKNKI
ncbi:MAG: DoxX family protein [Bdellovibrionales bacterium]|nr:DoxX family protein [Bdellovibrionales bacterium]